MLRDITCGRVALGTNKTLQIVALELLYMLVAITHFWKKILSCWLSQSRSHLIISELRLANGPVSQVVQVVCNSEVPWHGCYVFGSL